MAAVVKFHRSPHGSVGCTIGLAPHVYVGGFDWDPMGALRQAATAAASLAKDVSSNPALSAALNVALPGSGAALKAIASAAGTASQAAKAGATPQQAVQHVADQHGPEAAGLISSLLKALL